MGMRGLSFFTTETGGEDAGKGKEGMVALNTSYGPAAMLDTFIHGIYSTFVECLPGTPSVGGARVNKTASAFKEPTVSLGRRLNTQAV